MRARRALTTTLLVTAGALALPGAAPAAYPGTDGEIAFTSTQDGGARHIFVGRAAGVVDLTGSWSTGSEVAPKFSPDGRLIAFTGLERGLPNSEIFVMAADGRQRIQLTKTPQGNSDPTWSPDGTRIAFVSERDGGVPQVFVMRSDGSDVRQITDDTAAKSQLAWSPRGDRIAFVRIPAGGGDRDIYSINADGSNLTDLSNDPTSFDLEPAWSPDGARIAYSGPLHPGESVGMDLWVMNADGSGKQALSHEDNRYSDGAYPAWSPDGTTIAFAANNGSGYYHVWSTPAGGGQNGELITNRVPGGNPGDEEIDWQPVSEASPPRTKLTNARIHGHSATFAFLATGPATGYRCRLQRGGSSAAFKACSSPTIYRHLRPGRYAFTVIAWAPGEDYRGPVRRSFKIR